MLIIAHRGAAGEAPENTIEAIKRGIADDADIVEFDVRVTRDHVPVLSHDPHLSRTHGKNLWISQHTLAELQKATRGNKPIATLEQALKICRGKIFANIEIKTTRDIQIVLKIIAEIYPTKKAQSNEFFISSFKTKVLSEVRAVWPHAQLALLHTINPQKFIIWHKRLNLAAVGFHRLHHNMFATEIAQKLGLFVYLYTVNHVDTARRAYECDIDGLVTNYPTKMLALVERLDKSIQ